MTENIESTMKLEKNMNYKVLALRGFNLYFDQVTSVFKTVYETNKNINLEQLSTITGLNRAKASVLLNFLADLSLSQKRTLKGTKLGRVIHTYDDFLQKDGTLWLMHYLQSTNEYLVIWNRVMNRLYNVDQVTREDLLALFEDLKDDISDYAYKHHIGKELRSILDAYTNQRLSKLDLLETEDGHYTVHRNSDIPDLILLCTIILYRDKYYPGATAVDICELCTANNSPGKIFILDEHIIRSKIESLKNTGIINIESRGDLDQIRFQEELDFEAILEKYYRG